MKVGLVVPQFVEDPDITLRFVRRAEQVGLDGVFVFDHLWPFPGTSGPSLSAIPMAAAAIAATHEITVGTLVARIGITPDEILTQQLSDLAAAADGRFVAGLGIGDRKSLPENEAYGVDPGPRNTRLGRLEAMCGGLADSGLEVWAGGRSRAVQEIAARVGAKPNLWGVDAAVLRAALATNASVTWGGPADGSTEIGPKLQMCEAEGAEWAVLLVQGSGKAPEATVESVATVRAGDNTSR